ncbi:MAG TPA: corrinoid protein [Terriglobales bacterium]|jgi:corrinoid protein of di/trimethylamine methyltransferase|nr:corrinoid protein [Terriglobales bacterium]
MSNELFQAMRQSIIDGAADHATELARQALTAGIDPLQAVNNGFVPGVDYVGEQFARREMFLPDLVMAAEAMKAGIAVLEPEMRRRGMQRESLGRVVLGTVKGDIHEIGKTLVGILLSAAGFEVVDLGVNVTAEMFAAKARELNADIVGVSSLLTTTMALQRGVVEALDRAQLRPRVKIIVGGAPVTRKWAEEIGADGYGKDAVGAVTLAKSLVGKSNGQAK